MRVCWLFGLLLIFFNNSAHAKVYKNLAVGRYLNSYDLTDFKGQSFLSLMKEVIYPALLEESSPRFTGSHIQGVKQGAGVELRLTPRISTYHVKYEAHWKEEAERSGRSFAGVDTKPWNQKVEYVADASYKHYLKSLEALLRRESEVEDFYRAILNILLNCDPSGLQNLSTQAQQVAADFVAVYTAEQYRHLLGGQGQKLGVRHNWDNAHLQVTLLAAFHSGQNRKHPGMFYKGKFLSKVFHQKVDHKCVYLKPWNDIPPTHWKRPMNLTDYWQFNEECDRSGVNMTRRDFYRMGKSLTHYLFKNSNKVHPYYFNKFFAQRWTHNYIATIASRIISNRAPRTFKNHQEFIDLALLWIMESRELAPLMTKKLLSKKTSH